MSSTGPLQDEDEENTEFVSEPTGDSDQSAIPPSAGPPADSNVPAHEPQPFVPMGLTPIPTNYDGMHILHMAQIIKLSYV